MESALDDQSGAVRRPDENAETFADEVEGYFTELLHTGEIRHVAAENRRVKGIVRPLLQGGIARSQFEYVRRVASRRIVSGVQRDDPFSDRSRLVHA